LLARVETEIREHTGLGTDFESAPISVNRNQASLMKDHSPVYLPLAIRPVDSNTQPQSSDLTMMQLLSFMLTTADELQHRLQHALILL